MSSGYSWEQVSEFLDAVVELPLEERESYLQQSCADPALRDHIHHLLSSFQETTGFLEHPAGSYAEPSPRFCVGRRVGAYQLVEEIGEGGMGVVYRAIRSDEQFLRTVAIKLMKGDFSSRFSVMRFRVERQILASLDHRNIARLIDGGTTEEGTPYLVMELVEGQPIDRYCDEHRLSTTERLRLFRQACSAVDYAHQHLVIHRDLSRATASAPTGGGGSCLTSASRRSLTPEPFLIRWNRRPR